MSQEENLVYAYFRFYADDEAIRTGLNKFCTEYSVMQEVGYNYKEYKCFADNAGGLIEWVGSVGGYLSYTRETGFMDGSPSDGVFDQSLLMGVERSFLDDVIMLNGYNADTRFIFRKITAQDSGIAHKVKFNCGVNQKVNHPVMYTLDSSQVEILKQTSDGFTDNSDVDSYEIMVETDKALLVGSEYSLDDGTVTDFDNMFNRDADDYCSILTSGAQNTYARLILDFGAFNNLYVKLFNHYNGATNYSNTRIEGSNSPVGGWITIGYTGDNDGTFTYQSLNTSYRYVRISVQRLGAFTAGRSDIYVLMCS